MGRLLELMERLLGLFLGTGGERAKVEATGISVIATNVGVVDAAADRLEVNADGSINVNGVAAILARITTPPLTLYGATTATRPAANTVPAGTVFVAVTSPLGITMSNGSAWVVI